MPHLAAKALASGLESFRGVPVLTKRLVERDHFPNVESMNPSLMDE